MDVTRAMIGRRPSERQRAAGRGAARASAFKRAARGPGRRASSSFSGRGNGARIPGVMHAPAPRIAALLLVLAACGAARPAAASLDTSVVTTTNSRVDPRLALDASGDPHVLYVNAGSIMLASRAAGVWSTETVSSGVRLRGIAVTPSGRRVASYIRLGDRFVVADRETGGWVEDSSLVDITPTASAGFDLDPATGEPRVAYARASSLPPGATHVICYASRSGAVWTVTEVDSISSAAPHVTLALAPSGEARIGYLDETTYTVARETGGGFDREPIMSHVPFQVSLSVDPTSAEPRVAFLTRDTVFAGPDTLLEYAVGYAERSGGVWTQQWVDHPVEYMPFGVSLRSTAGGSPRLVYSKSVNILAAHARAGGTPGERDADLRPEGGVATDEVWLATRPAAAPYADFQLQRIDSWNTLSNSGSLALAATGHAFVVMRSPDFSALYHVLLAEESGLVSVPEPAPGGLVLGPPAPNPAAAGGGGTVHFSLPRATWVTLELYDLSGARRAALAPRAYPGGSNRVAWTPGDLPAGLYWLRLRSGLGTTATRKWVLF